MACLAACGSSTLVLTTNVTATRQWIAELLDKTSSTASFNCPVAIDYSPNACG
jgi:hypothetical protein